MLAEPQCVKGCFGFYDSFKQSGSVFSPELQLTSNTSEEALILRLLLGTVYVCDINQDKTIIRQSTNYARLPREENVNYYLVNTVSSHYSRISGYLTEISQITSENPELFLKRDLKALQKLKTSVLSHACITDRHEVERANFTKNLFDLLNIDDASISFKEFVRYCDSYLKRSATNKSVYQPLLFELCSFFLKESVSPVAGFAHLYRSFELIAYNFPLIFASKSKNVKGTYKTFQSFFEKGADEIRFLDRFIEILFRDEPDVLDTDFNFLISSDTGILTIDKDLKRAISQRKEKKEIDGEIKTVHVDRLLIINQTDAEIEYKVQFRDIVHVFSCLRNRYFHMRHGDGQHNIEPSDYAIDNVFRAINPIFVNWITSIYIAIFKHSLIQSI